MAVFRPDATDESTLETLIAECHRRGFRLHNLFEHDAKVFPLHWQANLHSATKECWEFGSGDTPQAALFAALIRAMNEHGQPLKETGELRDTGRVEVISTKLSLDDLDL